MASGRDQEPHYPGKRLPPKERRGAMIGPGLIWCSGCGETAVRADMGHKKCRMCRHPELAKTKRDLIKRYVQAGLPIPDDFSPILGPETSD